MKNSCPFEHFEVNPKVLLANGTAHDYSLRKHYAWAQYCTGDRNQHSNCFLSIQQRQDIPNLMKNIPTLMEKNKERYDLRQSFHPRLSFLFCSSIFYVIGFALSVEPANNMLNVIEI
jgi:hypothetical protein